MPNLPIFKGFTEQQISQLEPLMDFCSFESDVIIFEQGAKADFFYILVTGAVTIHYKPYDGPPLAIANIQPGGVFGWSAALDRRTYSSAAISTAKIEAIRIRREDIQSLCQRFPNTGALFIDRLASVISERIKNSHHEIVAMLSNNMELNSECWRRINKNGKTKTIHA